MTTNTSIVLAAVAAGLAGFTVGGIVNVGRPANEPNAATPTNPARVRSLQSSDTDQASRVVRDSEQRILVARNRFEE